MSKSSRLHVLIVPSWYPTTPADYSGSFFREQAQALNRSGMKVGVISSQLTSLRHLFHTNRSTGFSEEVDAGITTLRQFGNNVFPGIYRLACARFIKQGAALYAKYVNEHGRPDVIHAHSALYGGALAERLSMSEGIPYVVTEHSSAFARNLVHGSRKNIATGVFSSAAARVAVSGNLAELLKKRFPECGEWLTIPNIVDQRFLEMPLAQPMIANEFTFLAVSALTENKALDVLINAFAISFKGEESVRLNIVGGGPKLESLKKSVIERGIASQVSFLGTLCRASVAIELARASAFVHSSRYETFGVVLIEALAAGIPVVSTACGGAEDIVTELDGYLVGVDDVGKFASAMKDIRDKHDGFSPKLLRERCRTRFGEGAVTRALNQVYEALLVSPPRTASDSTL